jgi:hypothetical protein
LKLQKRYRSLCVALRSFFSEDQGQGDPLVRFAGLRALLEEREKRVEDTKLDDEEEGKEKMMETSDKDLKEEEKVGRRVEEALGYLLDVAIERFGYTARDVFGAIFDFDSETTDARNAFNLTFKDLKDTVASLAVKETPLSNSLIGSSPSAPFIQLQILFHGFLLKWPSNRTGSLPK